MGRDFTGVSAANKALAEARAWETLRVLNGGALSICPITIRPYVKKLTGSSGSHFLPYVGSDGLWRSGISGSAWCPINGNTLLLPSPAGRIDFVVVDGTTINPTVYRVDNGVLLVRQDGLSWPADQDLALPAGSVGTFQVTYWEGSAPDSLDDYAAGVLANEYLNIITDPKYKCRLPKNVRAITRQGVSYEMSVSMFDEGKTGIDEVDAVVARRNPYHLKSPPGVMSPELLDQPRQVTISSGSYAPTPPPPSNGGVLIPDPSNPGYFIISSS